MEPRDRPIPERIAGARDGRRSAATTLLLLTALVIVAVVKPWGEPGPSPGFSAVAIPTLTPASPADRSRRSPAPPDAADRLAQVCLDPAGWRIIATERWHDDSIRSWRAVDPSTAAGPLDPVIDFAPVAAEAIPLLGYCAPISGPDSPPADARGSVFAIHGASSESVRVRRLVPSDDVSGGAAWSGWGRGSSGGAFSLTWPLGRYVIRVGTPDDRYSRWIGVEIVRPFLERSSPSPTTLPR